jgi:Flp pilus assembly protein TadG
MFSETPNRLTRSGRKQQGVIMLWTLLTTTVLMIFASLVVDVAWLYFRREKAQAAADAAALAGDWGLTQSYTDAQATALAQQVAADYGFPSTAIVCTPHSYSNTNNFTVQVTSTEHLSFGSIVNHSTQQILASATATFNGSPPVPFASSSYGMALSGGFSLCAYGPDQGATRGDAINTRWTDIAGTYQKAINPLNYNPSTGGNLDTGVTYFITPTTNYSTAVATADSKITDPSVVMVQIYDPQTSVSSWDTVKPFDQYQTVNGVSQSTSEKWRYSLYVVNTSAIPNTTTQIASAVYGESDTTLEGQWVTPKGFYIDTATYPPSSYSYYLNVRTDDGSGNPGVGYDKNGYMLRAGPDFFTDTTYSSAIHTYNTYDKYVSPGVSGMNNPVTNTVIPDSTWNAKFGNIGGSSSVNGTALAAMGGTGNLCVNAYTNTSTTSGNIGLGYLQANPNTNQPTIITFNSFDEDSGATSVSYTVSAPGQAYDGKTFTGVLGKNAVDGTGNGVWSTPGIQTRGTSNPTTASNTVYFAPGEYKGGNWSINYATGVSDVTTWNWTVNWISNAAYTKPYLVYTNQNDY